MTDKEFKRLSRAQLIEVIYQFQLQVDELTEKKQKLEQELTDKRLRLHDAGNIAEAALKINDCFRSAQNAAEQYLNEIKLIREEAKTERQTILSQARAEADAIIADAQRKCGNRDSTSEAILNEYGQSHSDNG